MDLFEKIHIPNPHMAHSGRTGLVVCSRHKQPITDDVVVKTFHPTTGAGRSFLMTRSEVAELHDSLGKWLDGGWAAFVDGAPGPREGEERPAVMVDARPTLDEIEQRLQAQRDAAKHAEEIRRGEYANATHDELVDEIRVLKFNIEAAKSEAHTWREVAARERRRVDALFARIRKALAGKRTASVDDLNAALKEESE